MTPDHVRVWIRTGMRASHRLRPSIYTFDTLTAEADQHVPAVARLVADLSYWRAVEIALDFGKRFAADTILHGEVDAAALLTEVAK